MPKGRFKPVGKTLRLLRFALRSNSPENFDVAGVAFREKEIAIGRGTDQSRIIETSRVQLHLETRRDLRLGVLRPRHKLRTVA